MKVSSPVGDFPYTVDRVRRGRRSLVIEGRMGAWPSSVEVRAGDLGSLARLMPRPLTAAVALTGLLLLTLLRAKSLM